MSEQQEKHIPPQQCPSCLKFYPSANIFRIKRGPQDVPGPVVYSGCLYCLANIITDWGHYADVTCYLCGRMKEDTLFPGGAVKKECPLHANAARLLSQALGALGQDFAEGDPSARIAADIRKVLG
jgi:hypothetical protein